MPLDLQAERAGQVVRTLLTTFIIFICGLLVIGAVAPMRELASAPGVIKPGGQLIELRHVDGGEVEEILAQRGAHVAEGDVIVRLRPLRAQAELRQLQVRRAHLKLKAERLSALAQGRAPVFEPDPALDPSAAQNEWALYELEQKAVDAEIESSRSRIRQSELDAETRRLEAADLADELRSYGQQKQMLTELVMRGASPRSALLDINARYAEAKSRHSAAVGAARSAVSAIVGFESEIAQLLAARASEWSREYTELTSTMAELDGEILRRLDRVLRLDIRAPADGVIQELGAQTAGGVIAPGGMTAVIVPAAHVVRAEVKISPNDIGHLQLGDVATVQVSTFDADVFGEITGKIDLISPTSHEDENGDRYFYAELTLDHIETLRNGQTLRLTPGMVITAQIETGSKSVLRYLFKPMAKALDKAFSER